MKIRKQIMAVLTIFALVASLLPAAITVSAQGSDLFAEDFESYATGKITVSNGNFYDYAGTLIPNFNATFRSGDFAEIVEEGGNKYLKVYTQRYNGAWPYTVMRYNFGDGYSGGIKEVSYKYRSISHYACFRRMGIVAYSTDEPGSKPIQRIMSQGDNIISALGTVIFGWTSDLATANFASGFGTITQSINYGSDTDNYTITMKYGNTTRTKTNTVEDITEKPVKLLDWEFTSSESGGANGKGSAVEVDGVSYGVYAFDDIVLKDVLLELASTNVPNNGKIFTSTPFTMTFSEAVSEAAVTLSKNGAAMSSSDYTVTVSGQTVSVMPQSGWEDDAVYTVNVGSVTAVSGTPAFSGTAFTLTGSSYLFTEDFEGYEVGTIIEAQSDQSSVTTALDGRIGYQLKTGDKLEIAEDNGNKYLKITRASTSTSYSRYAYYFPQTYGGKRYTVSYDFMPEEHNQYFRHFGSLWKQNSDGTKTGVVKQVTSYGKNIYYCNDPSKNDFPNVLNTAKYSGSAYATVSQTIDYTNLSGSKLKTTLPDGTVTEKSVGSSNTPQGVGLYGLLWDIQVHSTAAYNGSTDHTTPSVYRIDNIRVKGAALELTETSVHNNGKIASSTPFTMTFSGTVTDASVTLSKDGDEMDGGDYTVSVSGATVSVAPVDGWYDGSVYTVNVGTVTASGCDPFAGATFTLRGNSSLFSEDFEDYPVGVIATGPADTISTTRNPGGLSYKLVEGDTLEVVEKDGSKVLKLTTLKNDTAGTERRLLLDFDQHYGDGKAYDVSFDYYVENNSVWFGDFGTLCDDKISGHSDYVHTAYYAAIKPISSYRDNLYFDRNTKKYYGGGLLAASDVWKQQNTTIDFSQDPRPFTVKTTKLSDGTRLAKESMTVSQTYGKQTVDNISSIAWNFKTNATSAWNGQDEGSGVYYFDNIKVKTVKLSLDSANVASGDTISIDTDINLEFNAPVSQNVAEYITITENDEPLSDSEYSVSLSEDGKTVTISSANGWDYDSTYILGINSIETAGFDPFDGTFIEFYTEEYDDTVPPNIVSSTIANGADNVDYRTESVILSTNGVILDGTTITKQNIKLYEDGEQINSYSVAPQGRYAVKVSFGGLKKDASYRLTVSGLMSDGANPLSMTKNFVLDFDAVGDIYASNIALSRAEEANTFNFTATVNNNTEVSQSYQPIVAVKNKSDGKLVALKFAANRTLAALSSADILISGINADIDNVVCELLLWKNISGLEPITGKKGITKLKIGTTVIFANNSNVVVADGEPYEEEIRVSKNAGGFVIPQSLASKYLGIESSLTEADIAQRGIGYYVSDKYDFIAIGDNVVFDAEAEENAIKQFGIYVSPYGDDTNSGYSSAPVKTLARAVKIYEGGNKQPIMVHGGTYRLSEAVVLKSNAKDGGIVIKDFGDGEVVLSGAVELPSSEFTAVTDSAVLNKIPSGARSYVKQISLADYVDGEMSAYREYTPQQISDSYYELFSGDTAQTIARWPNTGFSTTSGVSGNSFTVSSSKASLWKSADNGIIAGYFKYNWAFEDIYINKSSGGSSTITLNSTPKYGLEDGQRFYAMNMLEELDTAGEYYIDNNAKILYYYPTSSFASVNPELSITDKTDITDTYSKNCLMYIKGVTGVTISGITFDKTRGSGIVTDGGSNISIDGCTLKNIGNTAVSLTSSDSEVINSHIYSIGGAGIKAEAGSNTSLTDGNIRIADNTIHNFGRIFRTYQGAIHLAGCGNIAEYNTIYDAPHCAVRFSGSKHKIKHNIIHDVVKETSDAGAIYAGRDWTSWGTAISSNYFYNIKNNVGDSYTNQAVYIDDLLCGTTVSSNVIKDSDCAALFGGGRGNTFKNNIIANCNVGLKYDNRGENTSASQLVRGQLSDGSDTILEAFVKFLAKDSVIATMEERDAFNGFTKLVDEVNGSNAKLAYPKSAIITGNNFYGSKVNNSGYLDLHEHVTNYGTYSGNNKSTSVPSYDLPECGARN